VPAEGGVARDVTKIGPLLLISLLLPLACQGFELPAPEPFHSALSLQGFTGVLNTPSAHLTEGGYFDGLYTNQKESNWRGTSGFQDNFMFSLGFFSFGEGGARLTSRPGDGNRDLSANFKLSSAPLTREHPSLPVVALGMQDVAGGATLLKTRYAVLSEDIWCLRLSGGYGFGPDRMKGGFAGAEFKAHEWVYLLGEYDTKETNVGARVVLPQFWKVPVSFTATAKTSLNYRPGNFDIAVGFSMPLDFRMRHKEQTVSVEQPPSAEVPGAGPGGRRSAEAGTGSTLESAAPLAASGPAANQGTQDGKLVQLRDRLLGVGFLNVRVGTLDRILVVEYENTIFNHNELDGLGLVAGLVCQGAPDSFDTVRIVIKKRDIGVATVSAPLNTFRKFLEGPQGAQNLHDQLTVVLGNRVAQGTEFLSGEQNSGFLSTSLILAPGLKTWLGTENGVFDYLLSVKPELSVALWKGALVAARWDLPLDWSSNLDNGKPYRSSRSPAQMERLMLFQALQPLPSLMLNLGAGKILPDRNGMLNEAIWSPGSGEHRFRVAQSWDENSSTQKKSNMLLGSYRYYYSPLDLSLEAAAGRFWSEDQGFSLELKRFWQDTAVSLYFKDTKGTDHKTWKAVGLQFSFPLTPRRDMKPLAKLQVRGADEWTYAQESTLKNSNVGDSGVRLNYLAPYALALNAQPTQALSRTFYNRDRLSEAYILQHLERLREAWLKYGDLYH